MRIPGKHALLLLLVLAVAASLLVACGAAQSGSTGGIATASHPNAELTPSPARVSADVSTIVSASPTAATTETGSGPVTDQASLVKALQAAGATVTLNGAIEQPFLHGAGTQVTVDGQDVQVFEYPTGAAAQTDAAKLADVLAGKGTTMVNWVATPHAYQAGRLVALYIGDDAVMLQRLRQVLGPPVAELQRPQIALSALADTTPAASPGSEPLDAQGLVDRLRAKGLRVTPGDKVIQPFFSIEGQVYKVNDADVQVFEFTDVAGAQSSMAQLSPEGNPTNVVIEWVGPPHFYQAGRVIALYVGSDRTVIDALTSILGPQRAGR